MRSIAIHTEYAHIVVQRTNPMNVKLQTRTEASSSPSSIPAQKGLLQRKSALAEPRKKLTLQRYSTDNKEPSTIPPIVHEVLKSPGQPLDPATRAFMEPRFGHDFSRIRIHADAKAAEAARAVNARAFTVGRDVVFGTEYALNLRNTLLRISGAIQVLKEELAKEDGQENTGQPAIGGIHKPEQESEVS